MGTLKSLGCLLSLSPSCSVNSSCLAVAMVVSCMGSRALADIVEVGGAVVLRDPPASILLNQWESDGEIRGWFEREVTLSSDLTLGHVESGFVNDVSQVVNGIVEAGTKVQSYMVRMDPEGAGPALLSGTVVFDRPIIGVIIGSRLVDTDAALGRPGVAYNQNSYRGMELDSSTPEADSFEISADRMKIDFTMDVGEWTDDIRIVTAAYCVADFNHDGFVNGDDYDAFASAFESADLSADLNRDGFVNGDDYDSFAEHFEAGC
ncbi:MAG: hypothetical protein JNL50_02105 [Phycisphaerae bacterium]|nr:hypothetical protein [Phycisphaerae bacterium]